MARKKLQSLSQHFTQTLLQHTSDFTEHTNLSQELKNLLHIPCNTDTVLVIPWNPCQKTTPKVRKKWYYNIWGVGVSGKSVYLHGNSERSVYWNLALKQVHAQSLEVVFFQDFRCTCVAKCMATVPAPAITLLFSLLMK